MIQDTGQVNGAAAPGESSGEGSATIRLARPIPAPISLPSKLDPAELLRRYWERAERRAKLGTYARITHATDPTLNTNQWQTRSSRVFQVSGDHLTIAEIMGAGLPWYVRLGDDSNPFIRIREGDVLRREFSKVTLRYLQSAPVAGWGVYQYSTLVAYSSWGELIQRAPLTHGMRQPSALTVTVTSLAAAPINLGTIGKLGGQVIFHNSSASAVCYIGSADSQAAFAVGFPLQPGASLCLDLDGSTQMLVNGRQLYAKSDGATLTLYVLTGTPELDLADPYLSDAPVYPPL